MSSTSTTVRERRRSPALRFVGHYIEMVIVMMVGMLVVGAALILPLAALGVGLGELEREAPAAALLGMGFAMTVPMVWWMSRRGHSRPATVALLGIGVVGGLGAVKGIQHAAMFTAMFAAMLLRRGEYVGEGW